MSRPDLDALLNAVLPFAQQMLQKHGEFIPFGASMSSDGTIAMAAGDVGEEQPKSQDVIDLLTDAFREQASSGAIKASGICIDVRTIPPGETEKRDAILARLEHKDGEAIEVYVPYRKGFLGKVKYGELFAAKGTRQIFAGNAG